MSVEFSKCHRVHLMVLCFRLFFQPGACQIMWAPLCSNGYFWWRQCWESTNQVENSRRHDSACMHAANQWSSWQWKFPYLFQGIQSLEVSWMLFSGCDVSVLIWICWFEPIMPYIRNILPRLLSCWFFEWMWNVCSIRAFSRTHKKIIYSQ